MPDPIQTLTLLARLFDEQQGEDREEFYQGAAHACRVALQIIAPPVVGEDGRMPRARAGQGKAKIPAPPGPCPECGREYDLPQHLAMHRKRAHRVPSARDRSHDRKQGRGRGRARPQNGNVGSIRAELRDRLAEGPVNTTELAARLGKTEKQLRDAVSGLRKDGMAIRNLGGQVYASEGPAQMRVVGKAS